ncbi:MAG: hypothetical protein IRY99_26995, partial [Isosphaeraceae bacterium]|nr:hypothetical protein [Isosphaeraceae bacterium]
MKRLGRILALLTFSAALLLPGVLRAEEPIKPPVGTTESAAEPFRYFSFMHDPAYGGFERPALWIVLGVAIAGLLYA